MTPPRTPSPRPAPVSRPAPRHSARKGALVVLAGAALTLTGCLGGASRDATGVVLHPNVVWVSVEGAAPSLLQGAGLDPRLGKLLAASKQAVYFERVLSAAGQQPYAEAAALTSRYPSEIGPLLREHFKFDADLIRLPRVLGFYGYKTAAFWAQPKERQSEACDFDFGAASYEEHGGSLHQQVEVVDRWLGSAPAAQAVDGGVAPLLAYIQGLDCVPLTDARARLRRAHTPELAGEAAVYEGLNHLLERLEARGLTSSNTLFVLSSPCGPGRSAAALTQGPSPSPASATPQAPLSAQGLGGQGATSWLDSVHVPLVMWGAGVPASLRGQHVQTLCSTLDLVPTILTAAHVVVPAQSEGLSLLEAGAAAGQPASSPGLAAPAPLPGASGGPVARPQREVVVCEGETWVAGVDKRSLAGYVGGMPAGSPRLLAALRAVPRAVRPQVMQWNAVRWDAGSASLVQADAGVAAPQACDALRAALIAVEHNSRVNVAAARKTSLDPALRESLRKHGYW
jgi:Sulfatase